jgi:hypothetical protein
MGLSKEVDQSLRRIYGRICEVVDERTSSLIVIQPSFMRFCREHALELPLRIGMWEISSLFERLRRFFRERQDDMIEELERLIACRAGDERGKFRIVPQFLKECESYLLKCSSVLSKGEFKNEKLYEGLKPTVGIIFVLEETFELLIQIVDKLLAYGQQSLSVEQVILCVCRFIAELFSKGWDKVFLLRNTRAFTWLMQLLERICFEWEGNEKFKYLSNRLLGSAFYIQSIIYEALGNYSDEILLDVHFTRFFIGLVRRQYEMLESHIRHHIEDVHAIDRYAQDCNWRLRVWEQLLTRGRAVRMELLRSGFLETICA